MFTKLVIVALCVLSSTGYQWNQRQFETVLRKGSPQALLNSLQEVQIQPGQCSGIHYTNSLCEPNQILEAVKVTVTDNQPFADITIDNQLSLVKIVRPNELGYCFDSAKILIEGYCPLLGAGQPRN